MKKRQPTPPRYNSGDKVELVNSPDVLEINCPPEWNGLTWMYAFKGTELRCGEGYIVSHKKQEVDNKQPQGQQKNDNVLFEAADRALKLLMATGHFTTPTNEARAVEVLLIQARVQALHQKEVHDELVEALKRARDWFWLNAKDKKIPLDGAAGTPGCLADIEAALAKATQS